MEYLIGTVIGAVVGGFLISVFCSWVLKAVWRNGGARRIALGASIGVIAALAISSTGMRADEWLFASIGYLGGGLLAFVVMGRDLKKKAADQAASKPE